MLEIINRAPGFGRPPHRIDLDKEVRDLRNRIANQAELHIQPWTTLLNESIQFFIHFEKFQYIKPLSSNAMSFSVVISKLKRDLISIRELLLIGQDTTSLVLARTFVEDLEIAMAFALDPALCESYASNNDQADFWNKNIGYGRVYEKVESFLTACGATTEHVTAAVQKHREFKKFCSGSTHGGRTASLRSAFTPSLLDSDVFHHLSLGALSEDTPRLCLFLAQESQMFAGSVVRNCISKKPLHLFSSYQPSAELFDAFASAYVLQELVVRYGDELLAIQSKSAYA